MLFNSTRGEHRGVFSAEAIINGLAQDGGLYVPEKFPDLGDRLHNFKELNYQELAFEIIKEFFDDFSDDLLKEAIKDAYEGRFDVKVNNNFLELYHGPTCAFKDAALLFLPQIMKRSKTKLNFKNQICILTATSGDTGKAALEGFKDVEGFDVVVFFPRQGVSKVQERQMITQKGNNVHVVAIEGNFDDAQRGVKEIFGDGAYKEYLNNHGVSLSSANSINIGRLVPQIVYYFYGYFDLVKKGQIKEGEAINVVVPTGNFGNILAAYYGKKMGLPINQLICASNENNVLTDFINTGVYDRRRELIVTESPSMDILVSSNLERLLYELSGRDSEVITKLMSDLNDKGVYEISSEMKENMKDFHGGFASTDKVYEAIREVYKEKNYVIDTHTAVGYAVYKDYVEKTGDNSKYLIASTASPFKFVGSMLKAMNVDIEGQNEFDLLKKLGDLTNLEIPAGLKDLDKLEILHQNECNKQNMREEISHILELGD